MFNIREEAEKALFLLSNNGYEAYLVGGCVRDSILGRSFTDYDITTNALPFEIKTVFKNFKTIDTGIKHGTVTVVIGNLPIEITTYRIDGEYSDNRHPDKVIFSRNIRDDLSRRDFTMNAVCYNGEYIDLFCGIEDINNRLIRCVGDPTKRFVEDALRILRALRFSSCLGFEIEEKTSDAIISCSHLLENISFERISAELKKLLCGDNASEIISKYSKVFEYILEDNCYSERALHIKKCPLDFDIRLACILLNNSRYNEVLSKLKLDNKTLKRVALAVSNYSSDLANDSVYIKKYINKYGIQNLQDILTLKKADGADTSCFEALLNNVIKNNECYTVKMLDINGDDLIHLGITGKDIGITLELILENVIDGKIENSAEKILDFIKERINR